MKKKEHKLKPLSWCFSLILIALFLSTNATAQNITQSGVVLDQSNEPMIGVTVRVKDGNTGAITDLDGNFSIQCSKNATLVFSFMGYKNVEQKVTGQKIKVVMVEDAQALDEVVVVGYKIYNFVIN